jgi:hypothetical protein
MKTKIDYLRFVYIGFKIRHSLLALENKEYQLREDCTVKIPNALFITVNDINLVILNKNAIMASHNLYITKKMFKQIERTFL